MMCEEMIIIIIIIHYNFVKLCKKCENTMQLHVVGCINSERSLSKSKESDILTQNNSMELMEVNLWSELPLLYD